MSCEGSPNTPGWGATGFAGPASCEPGSGGGFGFGFGRPGFGPGAGGPGGFRHRLKRASIGTAAMLLDGPADAGQVVQRVSDATNGAFTPPQEIAELVIGRLAARGLVSVDSGVATLTDDGRDMLAKRGISSHTAHTVFARVGTFAEVLKIRAGLGEIAGMARTIAWSGTAEQKAKLAEVRSTLAAAIVEAKKSLHGVLAQD